MTKLTEAVKAQSQVLNSVMTDINELAVHFYRVGNPIMHQQLRKLGYTIAKADEHINTAVTRAVADAVAQGNQSSLNVLNAALAGVAVGQEGNEIKKTADSPTSTNTNPTTSVTTSTLTSTSTHEKR